MPEIPPTVRYQLVMRDLVKLAKRVEGHSREDKDSAIRQFARDHTKLITEGKGPDGRIKILFDRNMVNFLRRWYLNGHGEDVDRFKDIFLQAAKRQSGSGDELQRIPKKRPPKSR